VVKVCIPGLNENDFPSRSDCAWPVKHTDTAHRSETCEPALAQGCGASDSAGLESGT